MARFPYHLVDVFTDVPFGGNPLAVFLDAQAIPERHYQAIARELNLSETTFVLPPADPGNHFRVRIFTPRYEMPMAGHPTVGTAYVLTRAGRFDPAAHGDVLRLEEPVGTIPVTVEAGADGPGRITMRQLAPDFGPPFADRAAAAATFGLQPEDFLAGHPVQVVSCGAPFWLVPVRSLEAIGRVKVRVDLWARHFAQAPTQHVLFFTQETVHPQAHVHARMIAVDLGLLEDPATGGASGPLGCYLVRHGLVPPAPLVELVSEQGLEVGRPSFLHIAVGSSGGAIREVRVGGQCVPMGQGALEL